MANIMIFAVGVEGSDATVQEALRRLKLDFSMSTEEPEPVTGGVSGVGEGPTLFGAPPAHSRYEPDAEEPEPEAAEPTEPITPTTVAVDQEDWVEDPRRWADVQIPPTARRQVSRVRKPTEHTKDMHHQQVAKGNVARHAETPGPVVGAAPRITNKQRMLRLVAQSAEPYNRFTLLDAVMDAELASTRASAWQQLADLRKQGLLADGTQDGREVVVLTAAGMAEVRQCPSSAE